MFVFGVILLFYFSFLQSFYGLCVCVCEGARAYVRACLCACMCVPFLFLFWGGREGFCVIFLLDEVLL